MTLGSSLSEAPVEHQCLEKELHTGAAQWVSVTECLSVGCPLLEPKPSVPILE